MIEQFRTRHGIKELVVVADAGMLSADNLNGLECGTGRPKSPNTRSVSCFEV